jgi:Site-specific recombinase XerD
VSIKKVGSKWLVYLRPDGAHGKRVRKLFDTKIEATRFEKHVLVLAAQGKEWNPSKGDNRKLSQLVELWFSGAGSALKDGERRKASLLDIAGIMGDPVAKAIKPKDWLVYQSVKRESGIADKTLNNHLTYMKAAFNYLHKIEEIKYSNPLEKMDQIKIDQVELSFLTKEQIKHLLKTIKSFSQNLHVLLITKICLATGARWGEAEGLELKNVRNGKITFDYTKSGKSRAVPIDDKLYDEITRHFESWNRFSNSLSAFKRALNKSEIELPKGQASHVLRHSFASHFIMAGGNILELQKIMGHSSILVTMRYAHLSPDHLQDAVRLNPLNGIDFDN